MFWHCWPTYTITTCNNYFCLSLIVTFRTEVQQQEVSWKVSLIRQKATGSSASLLYNVPTLNSIVETGNLLHVQFVQGTKHRWTSGLHEVLREQQFENMMVFFTVAYSNEPVNYLLAWLMGWTWDNYEQIHAASNYSYIQDQHSNHLVTLPNKGLQNWLPAGRTKEVICRSGYKNYFPCIVYIEVSYAWQYVTLECMLNIGIFKYDYQELYH